MVFGLPTDDQRRPRFIDQDRIHLIHNCVIQASLHPVGSLVDHVVPQVIETIFVVRAISNVSTVGGLFFFAGHIGQIDAHSQTQEVVELAHPLSISVGKVVIYCDYMHSLASQSIEVNRQRGRQRFAFTRAHLGDLPVVQRHPTEHLDVEMTHFHHPLRSLPHHRKCLWQKRIQCLTLFRAGLEFQCLGTQRVV